MTPSLLSTMLSTIGNEMAREAYDTLEAHLAHFGFPASGRKLTALKVLHPALMKHLDGDPSPVPPRHAFIAPDGEVQIASALNSSRIESSSGVVLYMNLRTIADAIREKTA